MKTPRSLRVTAVIGAAALALVGCAAGGPEANRAELAPATPAETSSETTASTWPRTVAVGEGEVTLDAQPENIVALSTETSDILLELVGPEKMAAVSAGSATEGMGNQVELANQVETQLNWQTNPDPEQLLALAPDLVLVTERHDGQESVVTALEQAGIPAVGFTAADFASPEKVAATIGLIGELVGAEDKATELIDRMNAEVEEATAAIADVAEKPRTLVLMARGGELMMQGAQSATTGLVELAGGTSIAHEMGWQAAVPADPETIIAANPDVILVQDFRGEGTGPFQGLLNDPALADVAAIQNDRVETVPAALTSGTAGAYLGQGLLAIAKVLHPDAF